MELTPEPFSPPLTATTPVTNPVTFTGGQGILLAVQTEEIVNLDITATDGETPFQLPAGHLSLVGPFADGPVSITFDNTTNVYASLFQL